MVENNKNKRFANSSLESKQKIPCSYDVTHVYDGYTVIKTIKYSDWQPEPI